MIPLSYVLVVSTLLFVLGVYGALLSTNAIRILMSIEIVLNAVNLNLVAFGRYITPGDPRGQIFTIFVMTVAAAEAAVGLAIILVIARRYGAAAIDRVRMLKG